MATQTEVTQLVVLIEGMGQNSPPGNYLLYGNENQAGMATHNSPSTAS